MSFLGMQMQQFGTFHVLDSIEYAHQLFDIVTVGATQALFVALFGICGAWLAAHVNPRYLKLASGALFFVFGALCIREGLLEGRA